MSTEQHTEDINNDLTTENPLDIEHDKPSKSRFLFLLFFFGFFIFAWSGCYKLYEHKYDSNADVKVPENTLYEPKYK